MISGEVGGLGESQVVYLAATENGKELRSTTLAVGGLTGAAGGGPSGAAIRLLDPDSYRGTLWFAIDVTGATRYVNSTKLAPSATGEIVLPIGAQAIRVTHPEYHDFVRFIDVEFGKTTASPSTCSSIRSLARISPASRQLNVASSYSAARARSHRTGSTIRSYHQAADLAVRERSTNPARPSPCRDSSSGEVLAWLGPPGGVTGRP